MQAPMTPRRALTLVSGIVFLAAVSWWRLGPQSETPPPPAPPEQPIADAAPTPLAAPRTFAGRIMGTTYKVRAIVPDGVKTDDATAAAHSALLAVDGSMSTYKPESELSQLNRLPKDKEATLSPALSDVLALALDVFDTTDGAFDVTVGPLVSAWGFGVSAKPEPPTDAELDSIMARVGSQHLKLDRKTRKIRKTADGVVLDLSAIAKGYGVDRAAEALEALGSTNYMVEVGGEVRVRGEKAAGQLWVLGIEVPDPKGRRLYAKLSLESGALATSGDYRNFRQVDGELLSHTIDPREGRPTPQRTASVSVVRPTAAEADALATALGVMDPDAAIALADERDWAVMLLVHQPRADGTPGFSEKASRSWAQLKVTVISPL